MGLKITTDGKPVTVYRQDKTAQSGASYTQYSLGVASKDKDGNWVNGFLPCNFRKGTEIANKSKIEIINSFPTVRKYKDKTGTERTEIGIFVMDFTVIEQGEAQVQQNFGDFVNIPDGIEDEGLPFN